MLADPAANAAATVALLDEAAAQGAALAVFPELGLTGYSCADLFATDPIRDAALAALGEVAAATDRTGWVVAVFPVDVPLELVPVKVCFLRLSRRTECQGKDPP